MAEQQKSRGLCAGFEETDPELARIVSAFMDEVQHEEAVQLPARTRGLCVASTLLGCQGIDAFRAELPGILDAGVTPVELREVVYQAVDYVGIGRALPFVNALDEVLTERGVELPLEAQGTVMAGDRLQKGNQAQVDIFGEGMRGAWETCPSERAVVSRWLHARWSYAGRARDGHVLLPGGAGWVRTAGDGARWRQPAHGQRQSVPLRRRAPMPALYRLSAQSECAWLCGQSCRIPGVDDVACGRCGGNACAP